MYKTAFPVTLLKDIKLQHLETYTASRKKLCASVTVKREIGFMKAFFNKAIDWGYLISTPAAKVKAPKKGELKQRIPKYLTRAQVRKVLDKAKKSDIVGLICYTESRFQCFDFADKVKQGKETLIWLDDRNHSPIGIIIKKSRG